MNEILSLAKRLEAALGGIEVKQTNAAATLQGALDRAAGAESDVAALREAAEGETGALADARLECEAAVERSKAAEADLTAAQARISELEEQLAEPQAPAVDPDALAAAQADIDALTQQLTLAKAELAEQTAAREAAESQSASLTEALDVIRSGDTLLAQQARGEAENLQSTLTKAETAVAELQRVNAQLRTNNAALRGAIETGLSDPGLVDSALKAELEALQAARAADRAELDNVLAALAPMLKETADA